MVHLREKISMQNERNRKIKINKGKWMAQRERCRIADANPPAIDYGANQIGVLISGIIKETGYSNKDSLAFLFPLWEKISGPAVAKHSRPGSINGKTLIVYVDSSVWLSELSRYKSDKLLAALRKNAGLLEIEKIIFRIDPDKR